MGTLRAGRPCLTSQVSCHVCYGMPKTPLKFRDSGSDNETFHKGIPGLICVSSLGDLTLTFEVPAVWHVYPMIHTHLPHVHCPTGQHMAEKHSVSPQGWHLTNSKLGVMGWGRAALLILQWFARSVRWVLNVLEFISSPIERGLKDTVFKCKYLWQFKHVGGFYFHLKVWNMPISIVTMDSTNQFCWTLQTYKIVKAYEGVGFTVPCTLRSWDYAKGCIELPVRALAEVSVQVCYDDTLCC